MNYEKYTQFGGKTFFQNAAEENLNDFVDEFCEMADVLFHILQKQLHKSSFSVNGKNVCITIQRKVYTGGTSKPSPTRTDIKKYDERKGQCKNLKEN